MNERHVGLLGATSLVGGCLISLLTTQKWNVTAFTRQSIVSNQDRSLHITWRQLASHHAEKNNPSRVTIPYWICVAPIWVLPDYFDLLIAHGAKRIVALSSTSRFTKNASSDAQEREVAQKLMQSEALLQTWAEASAIEYIVLRPTLIYGYGRDKNVAEIAKFIQKFGFFPLLGAAKGLRQPIHADDVASACFVALEALSFKNRSYNLAGGELLSYRDMVKRVFENLGRRPYMPTAPIGLFRFAVWLVRWLPRYHNISFAMAERMNEDLQFDCFDAQRDLGFVPRSFNLTDADLPSNSK